MHKIHLLDIVAWISIPTVMFGGYSALMLLRDKLNDFQRTFFRLGHAHAGVLLLMWLFYSIYIDLTDIPDQLQYSLTGLFGLGVILQSGGFFWHAFLDSNGKRRTGMYITTTGAVILVGAIIALIIGLFGVL